MLRSSEEIFSSGEWISTRGLLLSASPWVILPCLLLLLSACSQEPELKETSTNATAGFDPMAMKLEDPTLIEGRSTWMNTCQTCHLRGLTGAPIIGDKQAWKPRIEKGIEVLFDHALNGFIGPSYSEMPPKGGFKELNDEQVKQAVLFMVEAGK